MTAPAEVPELDDELVILEADALVNAPRAMRDTDQIRVWLLACVKLTARRMRAAYPDARAEQRRERTTTMLGAALRALAEAWGA